MRRIRGFADLVFDLVDETSSLVEQTHDEVMQRSVKRFAPPGPVTQAATVVTGVQGAIAKTVFKSIRGVNAVTRVSVNAAADITLNKVVPALGGPDLEHSDRDMTTPMRSSEVGSANWCVDYLQSSLNGFWGDYLNQKNSRLDQGMTVRHHGAVLPLTPEALRQAYPNATPKLCIFVHGLASTEWLWCMSSDEHYEGDPEVSFGSRLHQDLGFTPVYLRYNTGLHISENGRQLADLIDELVAAYPLSVEDIALVGHSMGGLVVRSAAAQARERDLSWVDRLSHVACIGAPNLGAPLEQAVNLLTSALHKVDAAGARVPAQLLNARSAGVKDLRHGYIHEEEWLGKDPDAAFSNERINSPPLDGVHYSFFAATITRDPEHPVGKLLGDLLVCIPSAAGETEDPSRRIPFSRGRVFPGMSHMTIINHPEIYTELREALAV